MRIDPLTLLAQKAKTSKGMDAMMIEGLKPVFQLVKPPPTVDAAPAADILVKSGKKTLDSMGAQLKKMFFEENYKLSLDYIAKMINKDTKRL